MSQSFVTKLKYWFWLLVGIFLISFQVYKYFSNTLELTTQEGVVFLVGLMFMIRPTAIPDLVLKVIGRK